MKIFTLLLSVWMLLSANHLRADDLAKMKELVKQRDEARAKAKALDLEIAKLARSGDGKPPIPEPTEGEEQLNPFQLPEDFNLKIRQTLTDKNKNSLPGLLQYSHPGNGDDSYLIDLGVSLDRDIGRGISLGLTTEYHYNSASGKLKDTLTAGLQLDAVVGPDTEHAQLFRASASYKRDNLVSGEGAQADILWFPSMPPRVDETGSASSLAFGGFFVSLVSNSAIP